MVILQGTPQTVEITVLVPLTRRVRWCAATTQQDRCPGTTIPRLGRPPRNSRDRRNPLSQSHISAGVAFTPPVHGPGVRKGGPNMIINHSNFSFRPSGGLAGLVLGALVLCFSVPAGLAQDTRRAQATRAELEASLKELDQYIASSGYSGR